jgi:GH15 family glucan-1,4-alpha-glucosidase
LKQRYLPIEEHGIIGDLHTAALVGVDGTIDWMCLPRFDSPSIFAAILDADKGGRFRIGPAVPGARTKQLYHPDTNVLITRFLTPDGVGEIVDFMPIASGHETHRHRLIRKVTVVRGTMKFHLDCRPAFNYGRTEHTLRLHKGSGASFRTDELTLGLSTAVPLRRRGKGVVAEFTLSAGQSASFALQRVDKEEKAGRLLTERHYEELHRETVAYWREWLSHCTYLGRWRNMVQRSALALKLLVYEPTGALIAAPTTSLPESIGNGRNWDYRFTWIRDASFTLYALLGIGFTAEAQRFMGWVEARCRELDEDGSLQVMYGINGEHQLQEEILDHLEGYCGSRPVRIGNDAFRQLQLDIYGELMDSVFLFDRDATPISWDFWTNLTRLLNWLCAHWREPDDGIWEVRGGRHQFTFSKVMCWVAFDRALRIAENRGLPADWSGWREARDAIFQEVMRKGWDPRRRTFTQAFGSSALDAANLLMPVVKFLGPVDPRVLSTLDRTMDDLVSDSLVHRYDPKHAARDGVEGQEGTFCLVTFWLVEALTRAGRLDEARLVMEKMFTYANHLGLYAEEIGPSGEALGNFPQAFTHLSLITAAYNLNNALDHQAEGRRGLTRARRSG